ncbi:MAG TPA: TonB-dependent receptor [Steroidobacteraceae bacterium]|nr:TonB-dependent receptor [Steroidobacteraceae bacterium]
MSRSRKRKLARIRAKWAGMPLASAMLAGGGLAVAAESTTETGTLEEVVVTAEKRTEDVQRVPISLQVLSGEQLEQLQVKTFDEFAKYVPSLSYRSWGPGQTAFFFRGISATEGTTQLHAGYLPSTGLYLDDIPVSTIGGNLDIRMYDVARIEALAGPQGTLYGASSLSGTVRIITNKPDPTHFTAGYDVKVDKWKSGDPGGAIEAYANIPLSDHAAIRMVGYYDHTGGYINNVERHDTFQRYSPTGTPVAGGPAGGPDGFPDYYPVTINNSNVVENRWNTVDTGGGRVALKVDLNDKWSITPAILGQYQKSEGDFAYDPKFGDLNVADYFKPFNKDGWYQAALTIEGKLSNWDVLYSGGYFEREVHNLVDYSQYSIAYDAQAIGNSYQYTRFIDSTGHLLDRPVQYTNNHDHYTKFSNELRLTSPAEYRLRAILGAFYQKQTDEIRAEFNIPNLPVFYQVTGQQNVYYLSQMPRADHDYAVFADLTFDVTEKLKLIGGIRFFWVNNTLNGFFGFNNNGYSTSAGEALCLAEGNPILTIPGNYNSGNLPCVNTDKKVVENGETHRISLQYQFDPDAMMYGTYSTGFRPGGNNRLPLASPYSADTLTNYEIGWKTSWAHKLRFNGALFYEKWYSAQTAVQGQYGITSIVNAGNAKSEGIEAEFNWQATEHLNLSAYGTVLFKDETTTLFCEPNHDTGAPQSTCTGDGIAAEPGTQMPGIPRNKANGIARYQFEMGRYNSFVQGTVVYQSGTTYSLENTRNYAGTTAAFGTFNLSAGIGLNSWTLEAYINNVFDERGQLGKNSECNDSLYHYCLLNAHVYPVAPMQFGLKFGQTF